MGSLLARDQSTLTWNQTTHAHINTSTKCNPTFIDKKSKLIKNHIRTSVISAKIRTTRVSQLKVAKQNSFMHQKTISMQWKKATLRKFLFWKLFPFDCRQIYLSPLSLTQWMLLPGRRLYFIIWLFLGNTFEVSLSDFCYPLSWSQSSFDIFTWTLFILTRSPDPIRNDFFAACDTTSFFDQEFSDSSIGWIQSVA